MVLGILTSVYNSPYFPRYYVPHILATTLIVATLHAFTQGRKTSRERNLHARVVLLTGAFTSSLGINLLQELAKRGAHVIALSPYPIDDPQITILVSLLRTATGNENIFAEYCELEDASSVRAFCTKFLTGGDTPKKPIDSEPLPPGAGGSASDQRLDAIIFAHEYHHIGTVLPSFLGRASSPTGDAETREKGSLSTFLMTTLLLPALLIAPPERDIRIINVVNPFYAAAAGPKFHTPSFPSPKSKSNSTFVEEGTRSLRSIILTRHLQRILDALPSPQAPQTDTSSTVTSVVSARMQKSNIVSVSVSPGVSRVDTVAPMLGADWVSASEAGSRKAGRGTSVFGIILYIILQPLLRIFTKKPASSIQTVLHALFLPTPFKSLAMNLAETETNDSEGSKADTKPKKLKKAVFREVLKPGALYNECAVVRLRVPSPPADEQGASSKGEKKERGEGSSKKRKGGEKEVEGPIELEDDGEYGGEVAGRLVWEAYEAALKLWEARSNGSGNGKGK